MNDLSKTDPQYAECLAYARDCGLLPGEAAIMDPGNALVPPRIFTQAPRGYRGLVRLVIPEVSS